jgi:protein arginine kinase
MTKVPEKKEEADPWYALPGREDDVVLSTRLRLARNLADFPFPAYEKGDDAERVLSLVFDSFAHLEKAGDYQAHRLDRLDPIRKKLLFERGFLTSLSTGKAGSPGEGIVLKEDGTVVCTVNDTDHIRIASFASGLALKTLWEKCHELDTEMQKRLRFAVSYESGYLTSSLFDVGSGMRVSAHLHLPATEMIGDDALNTMIATVSKRGFSVEPVFSLGVDGLPLGAYYRFRNTSSQQDNEMHQYTTLEGVALYAASLERNYRLDVAKSMPTTLRDRVYRAFAAAKYCRFLTEDEAVTLISSIALGTHTRLITGVEQTALAALFYRIKDAHLEMVIRSGNFDFEDDTAASDAYKVRRMRALIVQEAIINAGIA